MLKLIRGVAVLAIVVAAVGWWRGWFTVTEPAPDPEHHKVELNVSVDTEKVEADAQRVEKIGEKVVERIKERHQQAKDAKAAAAKEPGAKTPPIE